MGKAYGTVYNANRASVGDLLVMDVGDLDGVGVQVTVAGVATITYEVSNDAVTWYGTAGYAPNNLGATAPVLTTNAVGLVIFSVQGAKWFRARVSAWTSGTVTVAAVPAAEPPMQRSVFATLAAQPALVAGAATIGGVFGSASTTVNGATNLRINSTAAVNLVSVKATAGKIVGGYLQNKSAAAKFVKFYAKASAPVVATDVPIFVIQLGIGETFYLGEIAGLTGISVATGIAYAITGLIADTDATAVAAGDVTGMIEYV